MRFALICAFNLYFWPKYTPSILSRRGLGQKLHREPLAVALQDGLLARVFLGVGELGGLLSGRLLRHSLGLASLVLREDHLRLSEAGWANLHRAICDGFQFCIVCRIATNIASAHAP
jgi:hypothetical protein